jgi:hypothetical protein
MAANRFRTIALEVKNCGKACSREDIAAEENETRPNGARVGPRHGQSSSSFE